MFEYFKNECMLSYAELECMNLGGNVCHITILIWQFKNY